MPVLPKELCPRLAPLPFPMAEHLLLRFERRNPHTPIEELWKMLEDAVWQKRKDAFFYMASFVPKKISTSWLIDTLSVYTPDQRRLPASTLSFWARRGMLRKADHGHPEPESAAALLIARMIDEGERNFLPDFMEQDEAPYWCFAQADPLSEPFPHPVSLLAELAPATLVWTPWAGAAWSPPWILVGEDMGAIRWSGTVKEQGQTCWDITLNDLERWTPHLTEASVLPPHDDEGFQRQVRQTIATLALQHLARARILAEEERRTGTLEA